MNQIVLFHTMLTFFFFGRLGYVCASHPHLYYVHTHSHRYCEIVSTGIYGPNLIKYIFCNNM
jgi:hypothetical protein